MLWLFLSGLSCCPAQLLLGVLGLLCYKASGMVGAGAAVLSPDHLLSPHNPGNISVPSRWTCHSMNLSVSPNSNPIAVKAVMIHRFLLTVSLKHEITLMTFEKVFILRGIFQKTKQGSFIFILPIYP